MRALIKQFHSINVLADKNHNCVKDMYTTSSSIKKLAFTPSSAAGSKGIAAKRMQEWLNLHGNCIVVDSDFAPATKTAVKNLQSSQGLKTTGALSVPTWKALIKPVDSAQTTSVAIKSRPVLDAALSAFAVALACSGCMQSVEKPARSGVSLTDIEPAVSHRCRSSESQSTQKGCRATGSVARR